MNVLILIYSKYGQTQKIADRISDYLAEQSGVNVDVVDVSRNNSVIPLDRYQVAIIGAPIYATNHEGHCEFHQISFE